MDYNSFVSTSSINAREEGKRQARKLILEKAKKKYEVEELRQLKRKESGEATWMLDTVSKRIHKEEKNLEDAKSSKKKKKKEKKKKKKHKHSRTPPSSSSGENEEETWVESKTSGPSNVQIQRDSWMESPLDIFPSVTRQELRDEANKEKEKAKREAEKHLQPGQHARELNPYWKDGGSGLPSAQKSSVTSSTSGVMGDGGLSWLLKSLSRMKEQAQGDKRTLEDIATERYGSLDRFMSMIREAEKSHSKGRGQDRFQGNRQDRERCRDTDRERDRERGRDGSGHREQRSREREERRHNDRRESNSGTKQRSRFQRPGSDDDNEIAREEKDIDREKGNRGSSGLQSRFRRPDLEADMDSKRDRNNRQESKSSRFQRPGSDEESKSSSRYCKTGSDDERDDSRHNSYKYESRHKSFRKPTEPGDCKEGSRSELSRQRDEPSGRRKEHGDSRQGRRDGWRRSPDSGTPRWKKKGEDGSRDEESRKEKESDRRERSRRKSSPSSDSSDDDQDDRKGNKGMSDSDEGTETQPLPKVMSEAELNALAAKVLRAEIMGDENLASQLKATLEEARRVRESSKSSGGDGTGETKDFVHSNIMEKRVERREKGREEDTGGDDNVVVLSRTNKAGMVRPVLPGSSTTSTEWGGRGGGKKKKRKNVATHDEGGDRTKFFHDDDNFDLKTLVEREKAGTAEDQNSMFARLAGRETDRDMDVDDMFVSKAARKQNEEECVNRDKMAAIMEHRKKSSAMEKCTRCFDKVPKHLIIAIGRKSYLCLPEHASLSEGHCYIVPMAHATSATSLDEDVWQDMQQFRKSLVKMFLSQEKDVVVMETVMHLKHFPHTAIECIPMEKEIGDLAPIYFKKAMQEVGPEWSHNKKVHDLSKKDVRHTVPKGFPYFSVDFGYQGGFAHVIEDEATFPGYFGREIVGGMLDTEPGLWRKPRKQNFEDQRQKVLQFEQWWSPFDWTQDIG